MEESLKNRIILILGIFSVTLFVGLIGSCSSSYKLKTAKEKEMFSRLDLEEKIGKFSSEKTALEEKLKGAQKQMEEDKAACDAVKKALVQEQLVNNSLKDELTKVAKLKEALEEDLKEALAAGKKPKK